MKIVVTAQEAEMKSPVDRRFGRARHFILYNTKSKKWSDYNNRGNTDAAMGAGISAAHNIVALGTDVVLTGHCGTWAFPILAAGGVDVYAGAKGTAQEAIDAFKADNLTKLAGPTVAAGYIDE
jgi:predicted Fe-Mo cluster-binding NifX family protein